MNPARRTNEHLCPACDRVMAESGCKIRCRACGYFEDCGDGLTPPPARPAVPRRKTVDATPGRGVIR